ncbi:TetR/AcrR family transcriptional regulator [Mycobacterium vicinigordonae]|uniref:TetR/AcrR family transcriptional regulator n=1 Tax=Mycobacterium vicinigordonae TaxID=1719132 RepID=A0A7D6HNJ0_9MYCO|nr:TetR/AcrR family transcriptional regulator [Mycobacterium vicinigordonae]QLL06511.1 TetR/AcrR family transcriptional regulator [Mycobacterium vicinigordonae]
MAPVDKSDASTSPHGRRGPVRAEQKRLTRNRLVDAARTAFESAGYSATSISDITTEAEINRVTFYAHFAGKAECFLSVLDAMFSETAQYWQQLDQALLTDSPAAIREWLEGALHWWEQNAAILPAVQEATAVDHQVANLWKSYLDALSNELRGYLAQFTTDRQRTEAQLRVQLLVSQLDQFCFRWIVQRVVDCDRDWVLDLLADMWCGTLHIGAAPSNSSSPSWRRIG